MAKDGQADTLPQVSMIDTDSSYRHIYAHDQSRLHNGHVFNTAHHSTLPFEASRCTSPMRLTSTTRLPLRNITQ